MFYVIYKIISFWLNKEKDDMRSTFVSFIKLYITSYNLETVNHIAHVIFVLRSATKTHLLTNQNARTVHIMLSNILKEN